MGKIFGFYGFVLFMTAVMGCVSFYISRLDSIVYHSLGNVFCIICIFVFLGMLMLAFSEVQDEYREKMERKGKFD